MSAPVKVWGDVNNALHVARLRHFREAGIGECLDSEGAFALVAGPTSNIENGIVCDLDELRAGEAERLVAWVRGRAAAASWMQADADTSDRLDAELKAIGCREETTGVDLGARIGELALPERAPGVEIREVWDSEALSAWMEIAQACGWFDEPAVREGQERLYAAVGLDPMSPFRHWLARRNGVPVGMATAFFEPDAVLLEHDAVLAEERRRGIGTALVGTRVAEARRRGCDVAVLSATPDSQSFYERLGFTVTRVRPRRWYYL